MEDLLRQDLLVFRPRTGVFDTEAVAAHIAGLGFSFRDAADPTRFVVTADAAARDDFQAARLADPDSSFPYVLLIEVTPERIAVSPSAFEDEETLTRDFLTWLMGRYACDIFNEEGTDLSEHAVVTA